MRCAACGMRCAVCGMRCAACGVPRGRRAACRAGGVREARRLALETHIYRVRRI
jgi:hypothetical protein